ncbi:MAG TPA: twin-arginine translocation signal domain-containing protein [Acidimicrobiales bacterium]|jgi:hypothetical protein
MADMNRRSFLKAGSAAAVAAGTLVLVPQAFAGAAPPLNSKETPPISDEESASFSEPLFLQLRNLKTGEMSLLIGEKEIIYHDRAMANRIYHASR